MIITVTTTIAVITTITITIAVFTQAPPAGQAGKGEQPRTCLARQLRTSSSVRIAPCDTSHDLISNTSHDGCISPCDQISKTS